MAVRIELKRSAVPGKKPTTDQLGLGEIAINTYDGRLYFKMQNISQSIVEISTGLASGSAESASYATYAATAESSSYTTTSSYSLTATTASYGISASYALTASSINFDIFQIVTGSVTASVSTDPSSLFLIKSGSSDYFKIASTETILYSDFFIVKNFTTQQAVLSVSQSVVQFATQSLAPVGTISAGSIWFTSTALYVGLD